MAKELPFFKFEPNQWENGNIQICTREEKGLFMDLCSVYWSRLGNLPIKLAIQKLCDGNATAFDSLINNDIFSIVNDLVCIDFLNEQLAEFENTSKKNSENAKVRWQNHNKINTLDVVDATALISHCQNDTIREDKIRKDNVNIDLKIDWVRLLEQFNKITGKDSRVINTKTKNAFIARLKEGYSKQDIANAIQNCFDDNFHKENNHKYLTLEFISRAEKIEKYSTIK